MALTDTALKALRPEEKPYTEPDVIGSGLYIEVLPSGRVVWRYRYRLNGKLEKLTLGKYPDLTLKNARRKRDEAAQLVAMGISPAQRKQLAKVQAASETTFAKFAERFYSEIQTRDRKDSTMPRRYLDKDILPFIGSKPMREITTDDLRTVIWRKKDHGFDAAAGQIRGLLKRMMDYAVMCGVLDVNPVLAFPMRHVHKAKSRERTLSPHEIGPFLNGAYRSNIRRQFKVGLHIILLTMVRKCELLKARWNDVHLDEGEWHIPVENSKTSKAHIVYLPRQAVELPRLAPDRFDASVLLPRFYWTQPDA